MTDSVEVAVTHQIKIGRDPAWIKVGVNVSVTEEDTVTTIDRASELVNTKIIDVIEKTVETVQNYEEGTNNAVRN